MQACKPRHLNSALIAIPFFQSLRPKTLMSILTSFLSSTQATHELHLYQICRIGHFHCPHCHCPVQAIMASHQGECKAPSPGLPGSWALYSLFPIQQIKGSHSPSVAFSYPRVSPAGSPPSPPHPHALSPTHRHARPLPRRTPPLPNLALPSFRTSQCLPSQGHLSSFI